MKTGAVIMASGFSRRMGENKLLLKYKGKTFIENTADKALEYGFDAALSKPFRLADLKSCIAKLFSYSDSQKF